MSHFPDLHNFDSLLCLVVIVSCRVIDNIYENITYKIYIKSKSKQEGFFRTMFTPRNILSNVSQEN